MKKSLLHLNAIYHCFIGILVWCLATKPLNSQEINPEQSLNALVDSKKNIGVSAAYSIDGETKWSKSSGLLCKEQEEQFSVHTLTRIASITKSITAVAIFQLVEQEKVELDAPIGNYLKSLPEDKKTISTRQLLSHTSGIPQYNGIEEIENTTHYASLEDAMAVFIDRPLLHVPGSQYFYTTYGYVVLGRIIEAVSGTSYESYMKEHIFSPSGMEQTFVEDLNKVNPNQSCLYHNKSKKAKAGKANDLSNRVPGGGFISTVNDLLKFGYALLDGKLISLESFHQMMKYQDVSYDGNKYGLGWFLYGPAPNEHLVIGHSGGQTGCTSQLMMIPKSKTVVVVLSNTSGNYPDIVTLASQLIAHSEKNRTP